MAGRYALRVETLSVERVRIAFDLEDGKTSTARTGFPRRPRLARPILASDKVNLDLARTTVGKNFVFEMVSSAGLVHLLAQFWDPTRHPLPLAPTAGGSVGWVAGLTAAFSFLAIRGVKPPNR